MNYFLGKWKEISNVKCELVVRNQFSSTIGSLSVKISTDPFLFLITTECKNKLKRYDDEFVVVNKDGDSVFDGSANPSVDMVTHAKIYENTNAGCVLHVHTVDNNIISNIYGDEGEVVFFDNEMVRMALSEDQYLFDSVCIPIIKEERQLLTDLSFFQGDSGTVLLRNHGIITWGPTVLETKKRLEAFEFLMSYRVKMLMIQGQKSSVV